MAQFSRRLLIAAPATLIAAALSRKLTPETMAETMADEPGAGDATLPDLSALQPTEPPAALLPLRFQTVEGETRGLADYAGRGILLNLWATWCPPCVAEMPALDQAAALLAPEIAVLPVSADRGGAATVRTFYARHGIRNLPILLDPGSETLQALGLTGLPTTLLIDRLGRERARLQGSAQWAAPQAIETIRRLVRA